VDKKNRCTWAIQGSGLLHHKRKSGHMYLKAIKRLGIYIYGEVKELLPNDTPPPLGKEIILMTYVDANLCHDFTTG